MESLKHEPALDPGRLLKLKDWRGKEETVSGSDSQEQLGVQVAGLKCSSVSALFPFSIFSSPRPQPGWCKHIEPGRQVLV